VRSSSDPRLESILRDLRACESEHGRAALGASAVFADAGGRRLDRRRVSSGPHKRALRDAGLHETLRLHDLRHTAAASWLAAGLPLIYVQRQLGHASITITDRPVRTSREERPSGRRRARDAVVWEGPVEAPAIFVA
jgi:integrase